jgi:hypothetical protein
MAAGRHNFTIEQGADFNPIITYRDPPPDPNDPDTPGDPIDITGFTARMQVRTGSKTGTVVLDMTTENGLIVILNGPLGQFQFDVDAVATAALTAAEFSPLALYDFEIVDLASVVIRLLEGAVAFSVNVTV